MPPLDSSAREPRRRPLRARPDRDELLRRPRRARRAGGGRRRSGRRRGAAPARARRAGARCAAILVTHGHWDHLGGVADLAEGTGAPVYMSAVERAGARATRTTSTPAGVRSRPYAGDVALARRRDARAGRHRLRDGARPGPLARRTSPSTPTAPLLGRRALRRLGRAHRPARSPTGRRCSRRSARSPTAFPPETVVYPGHGPPTTLGAELARNPFLGGAARDVTASRRRAAPTTSSRRAAALALGHRRGGDGLRASTATGRSTRRRFEDTELFVRTSGEGSDVVQKEMYTFEDRGGRSLTLRPEGTAPIAARTSSTASTASRSRRSSTRSGRCGATTARRGAATASTGSSRVEAIGSDDPAVDAEIIQLYAELLAPARRHGVRAAS